MSQEIKTKLNQGFPRDQIASREGGGGKSFSYAQGHYIIRKLNEIFGPDGWSYSIKSLDKVHEGKLAGRFGESFAVSYVSQINLMTRFYDNNGNATYRQDSDVGYGNGSDKTDPGKAHELATKEAVTDGLKRCAKSLGDALGLALYDKDQEFVVDAETIPKTPTPSPKAPVATLVKTTSILQAAPEIAKKNNANDDISALTAPAISANLNLLTSLSRSVDATKKATIGQLKEEMRKRYGTDVKENLTQAQIDEFAGYLKTILKIA